MGGDVDDQLVDEQIDDGHPDSIDIPGDDAIGIYADAPEIFGDEEVENNPLIDNRMELQDDTLDYESPFSKRNRKTEDDLLNVDSLASGSDTNLSTVDDLDGVDVGDLDGADVEDHALSLEDSLNIDTMPMDMGELRMQ